MSILTRRLLLWGGGAVVASAGFAFMASNNAQGSNAGVGAGALSGYSVTGISYQTETDASVPGDTYIAAVSFTLTPGSAAAGNVVAWFEDGQGDSSLDYVSGYYHCTETGGDASASTWTCTDPSLVNLVAPKVTWGSAFAATEYAKQLWVSAAQ